MFENTYQKLKICAYVFFIGNLCLDIYRQVNQFMMLGSDFHFGINIIFNLLQSSLTYFIISLFIYGFGRIVEYFEYLNHKNEF